MSMVTTPTQTLTSAGRPLTPHPHPHLHLTKACALPFVLLTFYGWHFAAAALTIFHDMLDRLDGAVAGALRKSPDVRVDGARVPYGRSRARILTLTPTLTRTARLP